ncbi:MAG: hypothetical protein WD847_13725 [Pirellulales bacterium]
MTAIWQNEGGTWKLLSPAGFPDEARLQDLVAEAPQLLPLSGRPDLIIVGQEVQLGSGWADLIAVEPTGRLAVIEIKLARNAEARRAVVAQVLAYAAYLFQIDPHALEQEVLGKHLRQRGFDSLASCVSAANQTGSFDPENFATALSENLAEGRFRLVFVLDEAPDELVRLVGYLESVTDTLVIDLVTIASYQIGSSTVLVPQRVEPERRPVEQPRPSPERAAGQLSVGVEEFVEAIEKANEEDRPKLHRYVAWARRLEQEGLVTLSTFHGTSGRLTLLPRLQPENVGLVTVWNDGRGYVTFWRSVFERLAPLSLPRIEAVIAPDSVRQGNVFHDDNEALLEALTAAYREAAGKS